jgi:superfamily II DNA or RNA helicase
MSTVTFEPGLRLRLPDDGAWVTVDDARQLDGGGWRLYVVTSNGGLRRVDLRPDDLQSLVVLREDGAGDPAKVIAALWAEWMRAATVDEKASAMPTTSLRPYAHQVEAVYGRMLPQPRLRFLLGDEPGTGKTIMAGLYLREMQRLGFIRRALVVAPAHLVGKWQADFERFLGGGLRRITAVTVQEGALSTQHDLWVVSLDLVAVNPSVQAALRPDLAGWDVVVIDEAHRLTPTAAAYYRVGDLLAKAPRVLFLTATPHRGKEWLFRALMHLVDPDVFGDTESNSVASHPLRPGRSHFLRRMKEELVDYDGVTPLFKARRAANLSVPLNAVESTYYNRALAMVDEFFPPQARTLARMVYGKRAASSLYALAQTLKRRRDRMGSAIPAAAMLEWDPEAEDEASRDEATVVVEESLSARAERDEIGRLLTQLDRDLQDSSLAVSKWPRLVRECLDANNITPGGREQAVVFTEYADTADWLVDRFRAHGYSVHRYSGRDPEQQREFVRAGFGRGEFQIIVSTDAGNEGIDLQSAHVLANWDIPWSLVRLEQRMGRIHRVGQTKEVDLYNLVASGTREGEALLVLLGNFVVAANQLDGKLFDSLSAVAELLDLHVEQVLRRTYESDELAADAVNAARAATWERLRQAALQLAAEENALRTPVDLRAAIAMIQAESLERVNPRIVEAFLSRLTMAGLIDLVPHAAAEGLFVASDRQPESLIRSVTSRALALVATSGQAVDAASLAGASVADAVRLGPGQVAFRRLVDGAAERLRPLLFQGTTLDDPTSVTDYYLCAFEATLQEFGGLRATPWPFLLRVDEIGARKVRWELLANLEPRPRNDGQPGGGPHPARLAEADDMAQQVVEEERIRRQSAIADWLRSAQQDLERLPLTLTADIDDPETRVATRRRIQEAVTERTRRLRAMGEVTAQSPRRHGWVRVVGTASQPGEVEVDSEATGMRLVTTELRGDGWSVGDVHLEGRGYDLHATRGGEQRCVEVKGILEAASTSGVTLTGNELLMARQLGSQYWLYVVDECRNGGRLYARYQDPAATFGDLFRDVALVRVPGSALRAAREESPA